LLILKELLNPLDRKVGERAYTLEEEKLIIQDVTDMLTKYENLAKGPAKTRILVHHLPKSWQNILSCISQNTSAIIDKVKSQYKVQVLQAETKLTTHKQDLENVQDKEKGQREMVFSINKIFYSFKIER
jgi:hypothetical protein